jgi:hypothetical protein
MHEPVQYGAVSNVSGESHHHHLGLGAAADEHVARCSSLALCHASSVPVDGSSKAKQKRLAVDASGDVHREMNGSGPVSLGPVRTVRDYVVPGPDRHQRAKGRATFCRELAKRRARFYLRVQPKRLRRPDSIFKITDR